MLVVCSIVFAVNTELGAWMTRADVEGKILKESQENYLVNFSKGIKKYNISGKPDDYSKVLVKKTDCVKE